MRTKARGPSVFPSAMPLYQRASCIGFLVASLGFGFGFGFGTQDALSGRKSVQLRLSWLWKPISPGLQYITFEGETDNKLRFHLSRTLPGWLLELHQMSQAHRYAACMAIHFPLLQEGYVCFTRLVVDPVTIKASDGRQTIHCSLCNINTTFCHHLKPPSGQFCPKGREFM